MDDVRIVAPLRVVTVRHLAGPSQPLDTALAALPGPALARPEAGRFGGHPDSGGCLLWLRPTESLCIATHDAVPDALLTTLAPGAEPLACAIDVSAAWFGLELKGAAIAATLPHFVDASAIPHPPGHGTRTRLADVAVLLLRLDEKRVWLLADTTHRNYLLDWMAHARAASG